MKAAPVRFARNVLALSAVPLLLGFSCDLSLPDNVAIKVQLLFTGFHEDVTATWDGTMIASRYGTNMVTGATTAQGSLPGIGDVEPPLAIDFPVREDIYPGLWNITVRAFEGSELFLEVNCFNVDIGQVWLQVGGVYTVRAFEDGLCSAELGDIEPPAPPNRDVEALSIGLPASAAIGDVLSVPVGIRNNGDTLQENVSVDLSYRPPTGGNPVAIDSQSQFVNPAASETVTLEWDTACLSPAGDYLVEAVASVPNDSTANNSQSGVVNLSTDRELAVANFSGPDTATIGAPAGTQYAFDLINGNSVAESEITVTVTENFSRQGTVQQGWVNPLHLACGETEHLTFNYFPSTFITAPEQGTLTVTIETAVSGDDPADNSASLTIDLTP